MIVNGVINLFVNIHNLFAKNKFRKRKNDPYHINEIKMNLYDINIIRYHKISMEYLTNINSEDDKFPKLYKADKLGNTRIWWISSIKEHDDGTATWYVVHGIDESENLQTEPHFISSGKNIGKVNETTPVQQALLEAKSEFTNKVTKHGYLPKGKKKNANHLPRAMKLYDWNAIRNKPTFASHPELWVQPKLDGVRCMCVYKDGKIVLFGRTTKKFELLDHIRIDLLENWYSQVKRKNKSDIVFDGELYSHGMALEDITSIVNTTKRSKKLKKVREIETKINYYIFDIYIMDQPNLQYRDRVKILYRLFRKAKEKRKHVFIVGTNKNISSMEQLKKYTEEKVKKGYEGAVVKNPTGIYLPGVRNRDVLKYKLKQYDEAIIKKIVRGEKTNRFVLLFVLWDKKHNVTFKLTGSGSVKYRREILQNKSLYIGKKIRYKYEGLTNDNIPKFATPVLQNEKYIFIN
jgi:hypothetical protein